MNNKQYQAIRVILKDGRESVFTGPVLTSRGGAMIIDKIDRIIISEPRDMPVGHRWSTLDKGTDGTGDPKTT